MRRLVPGLVVLAVLIVTWAPAQQATQLPGVKIKPKPIPIPPPHISNVKLYCGGMPCAELQIIGSNFGATRGSRGVFIDGAAVTDPSRYADVISVRAKFTVL